MSININISNYSKDELDKFIFIDLREPQEVALRPVTEFDCIELPLSQYRDKNFQFEKDKNYILFCAKGMRSQLLVEHLHGQGITNTASLDGGIDAL